MANSVAQGASCNVVFKSAIADWTDVNSSFDKGVLRIAYHGKNRNQMFISKKAFNGAIKSVFNCPVVCNYIRETDSVGAHDVDIIKKDGEVRMVNITTPVGVVPESANVWWDEIPEESGEIHEYLCTDILIWKRQEAYEHLKKNGITDESMEIRIVSGAMQNDGLYHIDQFEFLAFCLLESAPPCFESASIELFSLNDFKAKYAQMMEDVKREFSTVITASADDIHTQSYLKGGKCELDVNELMTKYSLSAEDITFDTASMPIEEIERKFAEIKAAKDGTTAFDTDDSTDEEAGDDTPNEGETDPEAGSGDDSGDGSDPEDGGGSEGDTGSEDGDGKTDTPEETEKQDDGDDDTVKKKQDYSLTANQFQSELCEALEAVRYTDPCWGDCCRYWLMDYDTALNEVYVIDAEDYKLYGMPFSMNGDKVVIDFDQRKRKKTCYVDFDEGKAAFAESMGLANLIPKLHEKFKALDEELKTLRTFKEKIDEQTHSDEANKVFAKFADLADNAEFKTLQETCDKLSASQIEEKCFAIRGRSMTTNFSLDTQGKPIRLPIEAQARKDADEPYGGVFVKYGIGNR